MTFIGLMKDDSCHEDATGKRISLPQETTLLFQCGCGCCEYKLLPTIENVSEALRQVEEYKEQLTALLTTLQSNETPKNT